MSIMMRPDSGTKSRAANQGDVHKHINELQQELTRSRAETQRARDKLTCLISLIRRSWNGDRNASIHLANIVGLDLPSSLLESGTAGRPASRMIEASSATRPVRNWERMTIRLLQRDNEAVQNEIREYQRRYIENRSRYMDEVMHFHQQDMARTPFSRPSSGKLSSVDHRFLQQHSKVGADGRKEIKRPLFRSKSAVSRNSKVTRETVEPAEVKLRDLFVESSTPPAHPSTASATDAVLGGRKEKETTRNKRIRQDYDDAKRYVQGNLFNAEEMLTRKPRPMSAALMRERDELRARPRSAITTNINNSASGGASEERPLKYETTRPVSGKKSVANKDRRHSTSGSSPTRQGAKANTNADSAQEDLQENLNNSTAEQVPPFYEDLEEEEDQPSDLAAGRPPISVRVKNAITRPESVDKFSNDLRNMEEMEKMFKKNTAALQKKLGLPENGMI